MREPGTTTACAAASLHRKHSVTRVAEERRGDEKRWQWKRKRCGGIHPRMEKENGNTGDFEGK